MKIEHYFLFIFVTPRGPSIYFFIKYTEKPYGGMSFLPISLACSFLSWSYWWSSLVYWRPAISLHWTATTRHSTLSPHTSRIICNNQLLLYCNSQQEKKIQKCIDKEWYIIANFPLFPLFLFTNFFHRPSLGTEEGKWVHF